MNDSSKPLTQRRHLLTVGAAVAAAIAGAGAAYWQSKQEQAETPRMPITGDLDDLWQMQFDKPDGGKLAMQSLKGKPLLINFWA